MCRDVMVQSFIETDNHEYIQKYSSDSPDSMSESGTGGKKHQCDRKGYGFVYW